MGMALGPLYVCQTLLMFVWLIFDNANKMSVPVHLYSQRPSIVWAEGSYATLEFKDTSLDDLYSPR